MLSKLSTRLRNMPVEAKASVAYAVCSILQNGLSFLTLPLFTRLLTTEQFGQYTIYTSWSTILTIFVTLNLPYGSFSKAMVKYEDRRDAYISSVQGVCLMLAAVFLLIYLPFRELWNRLFELPTVFILVMVAEMLANAAIQFWSGKKRFEYKYWGVIAVTLMNSVLAPVLAYVLVIHSDEKGYARILGYAAMTILSGGVIFIRNLMRDRHIFDRELWKYALEFNLPLIWYYLSQQVFNQSDRIMISHYCGKSDAAVYGVAYSVSMVLTVVLNAINNSYVPWFYCKIREGRQRDNRSISCIIAVLMAVLLLGVIWMAPEIIMILGGRQYEAAVWVVPPVAMSVLLLFYAQMFINVEFYYEKKGHLVAAAIGSALLNVALNALLIPRLGFIAAGYTTLASYVVFAAANYLAMRSVLRQQGVENDAYNIRGLALIFLGFAVLGFAGCALYSFRIVKYVIIALVLAVMLIKRDVIMKYVGMIRNM